MPFRILSLGGSKAEAGLFLGVITYASAFSAPLGGALADRLGRKPILWVASLVILFFSGVYALTTSLWVILVSAAIHGFFWSGLLSASAALIADIIPPARRAEGIGYWGIASVLAIAVAPSFGLWIFRFGWSWICLMVGLMAAAMAFIAWQIPEKKPAGPRSLRGLFSASLVERRVFVLSITLFLYSFGYGGVTSFVALYAEESGRPKGLFFILFSLTIVLARPFVGRLADRRGKKRLLLPCLGLIALGLVILACSASLPALVASALLYGAGFGSAHPVFTAYVLERVDIRRRGAMFGSILLAFDTGIGSGSMLLGVVIEHFGYELAFGLGALLSLCAIPYFLLVEKSFGTPRVPMAG